MSKNNIPIYYANLRCMWRIVFMVLIGISFSFFVNGQFTPARGTFVVTPPYPNKLSDYGNANLLKMNATITATDPSFTSKPIRLKLSIFYNQQQNMREANEPTNGNKYLKKAVAVQGLDIREDGFDYFVSPFEGNEGETIQLALCKALLDRGDVLEKKHYISGLVGNKITYTGLSYTFKTIENISPKNMKS